MPASRDAAIVVEQFGGAEHDAYWWALALGACFGHNATLVALPLRFRRP